MIEALEAFLAHPTTIEIVIRTLCVLIPAEGARIIFRSQLYNFIKNRDKVKMIAEQFGFIINIAISVACSIAYAGEHEKLKVTIYEGFAYGFGTVFIHWAWVKYDVGTKLLDVLRKVTHLKILGK